MPPAFHIFFVFSKEWKPCTNCKTACSECNALADGTFSDVDTQWGKNLVEVVFYLLFETLLKPNSHKKVFFFRTQIICLICFIQKKLEFEKTKPSFIISVVKAEY